MAEKLKGLLVKPHEHPVVIEVENDYREIQKQIHGHIQAVRYWKDNAVLCCDEDGKLKDSILPNRAIFEHEDRCKGSLEEGYALQALVLNGVRGYATGIPGSDTGCITDVILGNILILGTKDFDFCSLTDAQIQKYTKRFYYPEIFLDIDGTVVALRLERPKK